MSNPISQVVNTWKTANGSIVDVVRDGGALDAIESYSVLNSHPGPKQQIASYLLLADGTRASLPFIHCRGYRLHDRTGIVALFEPGEYIKLDGVDHFPAPNNAAIFNADGSMRFQLRLPNGAVADRIAAFHDGSMPKAFEGKIGVLIATYPDAPPEWVYAVDPNQPELISTGQWVRY